MINQDKKDQDKTHVQCLSEDPEKLIKELNNLRANFSQLPDKQQVWNCLIKLTSYEKQSVRFESAYALSFAFSHVPDKQRAWDDLIKLTYNEDVSVRKYAAATLGKEFKQLVNKQKAWDDLHKLTLDEDSKVRWAAVIALRDAYVNIPDKQQAWDDIVKLALDSDGDVQGHASEVLSNKFNQVPDKQKAWNIFKKLSSAKDSHVRRIAALQLEEIFHQVPDKQEAWEVLHKLTLDENRNVREIAVKELSKIFPQIPDKQKSWEALYKLTLDEDLSVRSGAAEAIGNVFNQIPDKQKAWEALQKLMSDEYANVRSRAAESIGIAFYQIPDKLKAWEALLTLVSDRYYEVRNEAAEAIGNAFNQILDKQEAWGALHKLTLDQEPSVRSKAAEAIGNSFHQIPDKQQARNDLNRLTRDKNSNVKAVTYHSLGKISIYLASQAEDNYLYMIELKTAIDFFEKASREEFFYGPVRFCLPFYRSFYMIIQTERQQAKNKIEKYLIEAKNAVEGSKNKKLLLKAVDNLAKALEEVQNLDFNSTKKELKFYRQYCEKASKLMRNTENTVPYATKLIKKGLPIFDRKLNNILEEIQEKANSACKTSEGQIKEIACAVNREVQKWEIGSQEEMTQKVEDIAYILKTKVANLPENEYVLSKIEAMRYEKNLTKQYETLLFVIGLIPTVKVVPKQELEQQLNPIHYKLDSISYNINLIFTEIINIKDRLSYIRFDIFKVKWNSVEVISNLKTMKEELEKLSRIEDLNTVSIEKLNSSQKEILNELNSHILESLNEIRILADKLPNKEDTQKILESINKLKQSKPEVLFQKSMDIISLIEFAMKVFPYLPV